MEKLASLTAWNQQINRVIRVLNLSRLVIFIMIGMFILTRIDFPSLSSINQPSDILSPFIAVKSLLIWELFYLILTIFSFLHPNWQRQKWVSIPSASIVIDITMISILTHLLGGTSSGIGILILPFLATSCLLSYGRYSLLYGSYATSLIILEILLHYFWDNHEFETKDFPLLLNQLILIAAYYLVPILTSFAASHLLKADHSVKEHQIAYDRISSLNQIITNRMQEAAIVIDDTLHIWLFNRKAQQYFPHIQLGQYAHFLHDVTSRWQQNTKQDFLTTCKLNGIEMHIRAIPLIQENKQFLTIFLRSDQERLSEAQTLKLTALGQLTANLAHEIRNPLSAVRQASHLLSESESNNNTITNKLYTIIENNVSRIDKMIEDISSLNKRDKVNTAIINLTTFFLNFIQEFQITHLGHENCLKLQVSTTKKTDAYFDELHLQQITWNLCNNAWRHSSKNKNSIIINISMLNEDQLVISFWDDGAGVAEQHISQLFEPFFTTQSHSNGTGLGLYVARELAHANRGDLYYLPHKKVFELILPKANYD